MFSLKIKQDIFPIKMNRNTLHDIIIDLAVQTFRLYILQFFYVTRCANLFINSIGKQFYNEFFLKEATL